MTRNRPVVVQVVQHLQPGGIETMALDLMLRGSPDRDVRIISLEGTHDAALAAWPRLRPVADRLWFLDKPGGLDLTLPFRMSRLLRGWNAQVVHTHHIGPLIYGGLAARLAGVRTVIHTEHDAWHLTDTRRRHVQSLIVQCVRPKLIADARLVADGLKRALSHSSVSVIPNGVDTNRFCPGNTEAARRTLGLPASVPLIGCAARLVPVKRHADLIDALTHLDRSVHLALAGDGPERANLQNRVSRSGLTGRVHFLGAVDDMPTFYQALDVFCLSSEHEGLPLSPLEAQAADVPCVLTDVGGAREALCRKTGRLAQPLDPVGLARMLADVMDRPLIHSPRAFVQHTHDLRDTIGAYEALHAV